MGITLTSALHSILEPVLNRALDLDHGGKRDLLEALAEPVMITVRGPLPLPVLLVANEDRVLVRQMPLDDTPVAVTIEGPPLAFAALAMGDKTVLRDGRLALEGDVSRAHDLQQALMLLEPDWEAALSNYTGGVIAHLIGKRVRGAVSWSRQAAASLNANVEEYIHEETRFLPGRRELSAQFADIDELSLRVERLGARIALAESPPDTGPETETL